MTDAFATSAGAYVLGALSPAERTAFEDHLAGCAACRAQVDELAGLPGLLARVPADVVDPLVDPLGGRWGDADPDRGQDRTPDRAPAELLPALLRAAADGVRRRRRRAWALAGGGVLAAAAAGVLAVTLASAPGDSGRPGGGVVGPSGPSTGATGATGGVGAPSVMTPVGGVPVRATISLRSARWGTSVHLDCLYQEADDDAASSAAGATTTTRATSAPSDDAVTYTLVVVDRDGERQGIGTWTAVPGHDVQLDAATALSRSAISAVQIMLGTDPTVGPEVLELDTTTS